LIQERLSNSCQTAQDRYRTTQERLSNGHRTAVDRIRNGYERLSNRLVSEDKKWLLKGDRKKIMNKRLEMIKKQQHERQRTAKNGITKDKNDNVNGNER